MKARQEVTAAFLCMMLIACASAWSDASVGPEAAADGLHAALVAGDESAVRQLLAENVLIYESGGVEASLEEYAQHHMHADMTFMKSVQREILNRQVFDGGDQAVVTTRARLTGSYKDRPVDVDSTETLVLAQAQGTWKVTHIHWSSRSRKGDGE